MRWKKGFGFVWIVALRLWASPLVHIMNDENREDFLLTTANICFVLDDFIPPFKSKPNMVHGTRNSAVGDRTIGFHFWAVFSETSACEKAAAFSSVIAVFLLFAEKKSPLFFRLRLSHMDLNWH